MDWITLLIIVLMIPPTIIASVQISTALKRKQKIKLREKTLHKSSITYGTTQALYILNFTHPLTDANLIQLQNLIDKPIAKIIELQYQFDHDKPFSEQCSNIIAKISFTAQDWQTRSILVHLPGFAPAAATLLAELHGLMGHFPTILRLSPVPGTTLRTFDIAELINLQDSRDEARSIRIQKNES